MFDSHHHPADAELRAHAARRLPPETALALSDHLVDCAECRERLRVQRVAPRMPVELDPPQPASGPDYEWLAAAAERALEPETQAAVERAAAESPAVAAELADLREGAAVAARIVPLRAAPAASRGFGARWLAAAAMLMLGLGLWWLARPQVELPPDLRAVVARLEEDADLDAVLGTDLRPRALQLSGPPGSVDDLQVLAPIGTSVREILPRLQWRPLPRAQGYRVVIERLDSGEVVTSPLLPADAREWTPPALAPGALHQWEVEAFGPEETLLAKSPRPPQPEARFRILRPAEAEELRAAEARWGADAFVRGALRARAGLRAEAMEAFTQAAQGSGPRAEAARKILAGVR